ncbi:MAG: hypothetical protein EXR98_02760 [Gemmataceae bacterium]|nr:hypothetical protein [Gemmataceae bacterium]
MAMRKWIVRGIVWGIVGACAAGALAYQRWTDPGAVREQVIAALSEAFPGAHVSIDSARLRLFGGIQLNGLRLTRDDDPAKHEFLHVPSAIFYHDKEKILDGELKLRKIELIRPRFRIRRERDGSWNLKDIVKPPNGAPQTQLPAIVIHQGTLILEDRSDAAKPTTLEINDVGLTIINDPLPRVLIRGAANSELLGKLHMHGFVDRTSGDTSISFRATEIPLTPALLARLPIPCPPDLFVGLQVIAKAKVEGKVSFHPGQPEPIYYDVHCEVKDGTVQHPNWPLPLENLALQFHCNTGTLQLESLTARSGSTEISAHGVGRLPCVDQEFEVHLDLKHVMLGDDLASRLPSKLRELHKLFQPNGPTTIHIACARHEGHWAPLASGEPSQVSLRPELIAMTFIEFPYPLERVKGDIDYNLLNEHMKFSLDAYAGAQPVILGGYWNGDGRQADVKFDIRGNNITIDEKLLKALPPSLQNFARSFHATGKIDVRSHIRQEPGKDFRNEYHIRIHDTAVKWDPFPYPLENVSGFLDIYPEHWEFHDFQGTRNGGHVLINGKSIPRTDAKGISDMGVSLEITGRNVPLNHELRDAVRPMKELHKAWETFNPTGKLFFTASVERPSADLNDLEVHVDARGATVTPTFFHYRIQDINGQFRFHKMRLEISKLRARHDDALIAMGKGAVDLNPLGGYFAKFDDVQLTGMRLDNEFIKALPDKLQTAAKMLRLEDPLRVKTQVVIAQPPEIGKPPDIYWDGEVRMYEAKLTTGLEFTKVTGSLSCRGRYDGRQMVGVEGNVLLDQAYLFEQPFKKVHAKFEIRKESPEILLVGLRAPIYGGDITGQVRVDFNSSLRYEMNLTASQINLAEFGRQNLGPKSQLSGAAGARLYLTGFGAGIDTLDGNGSIDIPRGHLYNLPFLLDLLKFLGLHWPDRTAFEEFHTGFTVQGPKVTVQKLDLLGSAVSLSGKGEFDLGSKNLSLAIYPMWGRVEQLLPPAIRPFPTTLSKNLLTVEVRGKVSGNPKDLKYRMKPMPVIVDPLLLLRDRILGQPTGNAVSPTPTRAGP